MKSVVLAYTHFYEVSASNASRTKFAHTKYLNITERTLLNDKETSFERRSDFVAELLDIYITQFFLH